MFAPHHRKDPEFRQVRLTPQVFEDLLEFLVRQAVPLNDLRRNVGRCVFHKIKVTL